MHGRDRGSMLVLTVLVGLAITAATLMALVPIGRALIDHQRAQSVADAAALAGVTGGRQASAGVAAANRATLASWERSAGDVIVVVVVEGQGATARATDAP
jgi:Flp pilus assembly protein TadG